MQNDFLSVLHVGQKVNHDIEVSEQQIDVGDRTILLFQIAENQRTREPPTKPRPMSNIERRILIACLDESKSTPDLLHILGYKTRTGNFKRAFARFVGPWLPRKDDPGVCQGARTKGIVLRKRGINFWQKMKEGVSDTRTFPARDSCSLVSIRGSIKGFQAVRLSINL